MLRSNVGVHDHTLHPPVRVLARVLTQRNARRHQHAQAGVALGVSLVVAVPISIDPGKYLRLLLQYEHRVRGRDEEPRNDVIWVHIYRMGLCVVCIL